MAVDPTLFNTGVNQALWEGYVEPEQQEEILGRDTFLKMLVTQLKHQDPLNPMEGTDFTAQLAQFSGLEQQFDMNDSLEAILSALTAKPNDENVLDYIGKQVAAENNTIAVKDGGVSGGTYSLGHPADVAISIFDSDGLEIGSIYAGQKGIGSHEINWNGKDQYGEITPDGVYTFVVMASNGSGGIIPVDTSVSGKVTGVTYENGIPYLVMNDQLVDPDTVFEITLLENDTEDTEEVDF